MGDAVWEETQNQGFPLTDKHVGKIADDMRARHGMDIWARRIFQKIKALDHPDLLVIDGIRNVEEIECFKRELGSDFVIIVIEAPEQVREQRALARGREDDSTSREEFKKRDQRELSWGLDKVIASADVVIFNNGDLEVFQKKIHDVFQTLLNR